MAATETLPQAPESLQARHGVATLFGYGITVRVDRGHLILRDGIGAERREARLPRVGHGLKRLVCISEDGFATLSALKWLADVGASFTMLDRTGNVLFVTGPTAPSDARLRRAQALAGRSGTGLRIARELISRKLAGQEQVARHGLLDSTTAEAIAHFRDGLATAETMDAIRLLESRAGAAYWTAWHNLPVTFPKNDLRRVPDHWRTFGTRKSPLSGSPRLAVNPANVILNYLYALLESEARLAAAAIGLDPGLGLLHVDSRTRDSLACDLMEPVRPQVDAYLLDWITRQPLRREWFFEQRDGNCRLMGSFAVRLSETVPTWARAVAPVAEWLARSLWSEMPKPVREVAPATHLTQRHRRESRGSSPNPSETKPPRPQSVCRMCGTPIKPECSYCVPCGVAVSREGLRDVARVGRVVAQGAEAQARRTATKRRHDAARRSWSPSSHPAWLTDETYTRNIQPRLGTVTIPAISAALGVSEPYAADIRAGRRRPHPRHWQALANLVGVSPEAAQRT